MHEEDEDWKMPNIPSCCPKKCCSHTVRTLLDENEELGSTRSLMLQWKWTAAKSAPLQIGKIRFIADRVNEFLQHTSLLFTAETAA